MYPFDSYFPKTPNCCHTYRVEASVDAADAVVLVAALHAALCDEPLEVVLVFLLAAVVALHDS